MKITQLADIVEHDSKPTSAPLSVSSSVQPPAAEFLQD